MTEEFLLSGNLSCSQASLISDTTVVIPLAVLNSGWVEPVWCSVTNEDGGCTWVDCLPTSPNYKKHFVQSLYQLI